MSIGNEPAYPAPESLFIDGPHYATAGLTKRELIAAMVMQGFIGSEVVMRFSDSVITANPELSRSEWLAEQAISFADALLAQLSNEPPHE